MLLKSQTPTFDYKLALDYRGGGGKCHLGELHWMLTESHPSKMQSRHLNV